MTTAKTANTTAKRGRPSRINREAIARAALAIGLDKVTIPALAAHLQIDHSSLYHHIKGRDDVLTLAAELAVTELAWQAPASADWQQQLIALTDAIWLLYESNPGLAECFHQAEVSPTVGIRAFAQSVASLQQQGFRLDDAVLAVDMLVDMVQACFVGWWSASKQDGDGTLRKDRMMALWRAEAAACPELASQINSMVGIMQAGARRWWEQKRDVVLAGIASRRQLEQPHELTAPQSAAPS